MSPYEFIYLFINKESRYRGTYSVAALRKYKHVSWFTVKIQLLWIFIIEYLVPLSLESGKSVSLVGVYTLTPASVGRALHP